MIKLKKMSILPKKKMTKRGLELLLMKADKKIAELERFKEAVIVAMSSNPPGKPPKLP